MSTDYTLKICRKEDHKEIAEVGANVLKCILDSSFAKFINCDSGNCDGATFDYDMLHKTLKYATKKIDMLQMRILEKKLLSAQASNVDVKNSFEEDILDIYEEINEVRDVAFAICNIIGMIECVVEELVDMKYDLYAYKYNACDMNSDDGTTKYLWCSDIYCKVKAYW